MAEQDVKQAFLDAILDADSLEQFINGSDSETVLTRLSAEYPTLQNAIKQMFENGGLPAEYFTTYDLMVSSNSDSKLAVVTNDADISRNGLYQNFSGSWVYVKYNTRYQVEQEMLKKGTVKILPSSLSNVRYTTQTGKLEFVDSVFVNGYGFAHTLATPVSVTLSVNRSYRLEYNPSSKSLRVGEIYAKPADGWLYAGTVTKTPTGMISADFEGYLIDGVVHNGEPEPDEIAKTNYSLALTDPDGLNIDFNNNKIEILKPIWIAYDGGRVQVPVGTVELPTDRSVSYKHVLAVDPVEQELVVISQAFGYELPKDHLIIGAYRESRLEFWGLDNFMLNGKPYNKARGFEVVPPAFGFDTNNPVKVGSENSYTGSDSVSLSGLTSSIVYSWFDSLMSSYPDYITRTRLGYDETGTLPIYQYRFKPKLPTASREIVTPKIPKVMLSTEHNEKMNFVYIYNLMEAICERWHTNDGLSSLRHGVEFVIIPVGNPWGLDNNSRPNVNTVDINRNYPVGWIETGEPGGVAYGGTAPLSEAETQAIWNSMKAEMPDVFYDCHSYGAYKVDGESIWVPLVNDETLPAVVAACSSTYVQHKKDKPWLADMDNLMRLSDDRILGGGIASKAADSLGCVGGTVETAHNLKDDPDGEQLGGNNMVNLASDFIGNLILQSIGVALNKRYGK